MSVFIIFVDPFFASLFWPCFGHPGHPKGAYWRTRLPKRLENGAQNGAEATTADPHETCAGVGGSHVPPLGAAFSLIFLRPEKEHQKVNIIILIREHGSKMTPTVSLQGPKMEPKILPKSIPKSSLSDSGRPGVPPKPPRHPPTPKRHRKLLKSNQKCLEKEGAPRQLKMQNKKNAVVPPKKSYFSDAFF